MSPEILKKAIKKQIVQQKKMPVSQSGSQVRQFPVDSNVERLEKIGQNYAKAMSRREGRTVTSPAFLADTWQRNSANFLRHKDNFLMLRQMGPNSYVASHFAPATIRGGRDLIKKSLSDKANIVFAVPEDLQRDLGRLGYKPIPKLANRAFHKLGMPEEKGIMVQSNLKGLAALKDVGVENLKSAIANHHFPYERETRRTFHRGENPRFKTSSTATSSTFSKPISQIIPQDVRESLKGYSASMVRNSNSTAMRSRKSMSPSIRRMTIGAAIAGPVAAGAGALLRQQMMKQQPSRNR